MNIAALRGALAGYANRRFESSAGPAEVLFARRVPGQEADARRRLNPETTESLRIESMTIQRLNRLHCGKSKPITSKRPNN